MVSFGIIEKEFLLSDDFQVMYTTSWILDDINLYGFSPLSWVRTPRDHWLYLSDGSGDFSVLSGLSGCALLCVGETIPQVPENVRLLVCRTDPASDAMSRVCEFLSDIFSSYQQWEEALDRCVQSEDFQTMLDLTAPLFRTTVSLFDSEYHWLGISGPEYPFYQENNRQLPADFVRAVMEDQQELEVQSHRSAFVAPDPENYFNTQALCFNLFIQDLYWGRIVVMDHQENREFVPGDYWLMNRLGARMQTLLRQREGDLWTPRQGGVSGLCRLIRPLLNREPVSDRSLHQAMSSAGWSDGDSFFVGHLLLNQDNPPASAKAFYCRYVMQENPHVAAAEVDDQIILLIPRSRYPELSVFLSGFVLILRENNFRLGLSNAHSDLRQLPDLYHQAIAAYSIGSSIKPHYWYHIFSDYSLECLLRLPGQIPIRYFCSEKVRMLADYDRENDTEYIKTLKTYIQCQLNAVQTARELYIHHATMVFRLKRLKEIMNVDLRNMDQIVELYLSLRILELEQAGSL